ncbi:MAG: hypothetical protein ACREOG_09820 [Gemmatimonadaceae bacterium]
MESSLHPAVFGAIVAMFSLLALVGTWFLVTAILAAASGWPELANTFPGAERPAGKVLRRLVLKVGSVGENGVTALVPTAQGLYLESHPLFRFRRPAVHVPWNRIRFVDSHRILWQRSFTLDLGGVTTMRVRVPAVRILREHGVQIPHEAAA